MHDFKERTLVTDPQKAFHFTDLQRLKPTRANDPYDYQAGWGNRHQSEVIPGTLPVAQNNPQETRFGLYTEGITYSAFAAPRAHNFSTYMYRCRPAAAHSMYFMHCSTPMLNISRWLHPDQVKVKHPKLLPFPQPQGRYSTRAG
jgi:homogentisate 1,2-dioxygenase